MEFLPKLKTYLQNSNIPNAYSGFNEKELEEREKNIWESVYRNLEFFDKIFSKLGYYQPVEDTEKRLRQKYNSMSRLLPTYHNIYRILQVHHTYYIDGKLPWDYPKEDLQTLCKDCHIEVHLNTKIRVCYEGSTGRKIGCLNNCTRCQGTGYLEDYRHVQNGLCFQCWGTGGDVSLSE